MVTVGSRLKEIRKLHRLNQTEFAKRLEITQGTYSGIEIGRETLTERTKKMICMEFGINEEWLSTGKGEIFKSMDLSHNGKELLEIFDKLDPEWKKQVISFAEERLKLQQFQEYQNTRKSIKDNLDKKYRDYAEKLGPGQEELKNRLLATIQDVEEKPDV